MNPSLIAARSPIFRRFVDSVVNGGAAPPDVES
jgi:hypothetical protein